MKRIFALVAISAMGLLGVLLATPGANHKVDWCHYPPGQWTGNPTTSKVLILSIDVAAENGNGASAHLGHSPSLSTGACQPLTFNGKSAVNCAEGVVDVATWGGNGCPNVAQVQPKCSDQVTGDGYTLVGTYPACVCPAGTIDGDKVPPTGPMTNNCGGTS